MIGLYYGALVKTMGVRPTVVAFFLFSLSKAISSDIFIYIYIQVLPSEWHERSVLEDSC